MTAFGPNQPLRSPRRVETIDFWRGLVLCTIFVNHIPGNVFEKLTQKNFGFSDSAEAFVFLSGASLALAYAPRFGNGQATEVVVSLARRAVKLYGVHIVLSLAAIGIFSLGALATQSDALLEVHGRDLFVDDPKAALIGLVSLGHQLGYFNILPLYILLLAFVPPLLWLGRIRPALMVSASFVLYLAARWWGWNMPTWPMKGTWFLDPFAWQFLMAVGLWTGLTLRAGAMPRSPALTLVAVGIVSIGAISVSNALSLAPGLDDWMRSWADLDKTVLGFGRVVHFLGFAYLLHVLNMSAWFRGRAFYKGLSLLGRNSLWMFALLSLMAAVGQVVTDAFGNNLVLDALMIGGGLGGLYGAAFLLELRLPRRDPVALARAASIVPRRG